MVSQGASEQEIQAFLDQVGITMEELEMARDVWYLMKLRAIREYLKDLPVKNQKNYLKLKNKK